MTLGPDDAGSGPNELNVPHQAVKEVLVQRSSERQGCLSLPFTVAFFVFYTLSVTYHEDTRSVYLVESSLRSFLEEYSFDDAQSRTLEGITEVKDIWNFFHQALVPATFMQSDHIGNSLPKNKWGKVLGTNQMRAGLLIEHYRKPDAGPPGNWEMLSEANSTLFNFPGEGSVSAAHLPDSVKEDLGRRLKGAKDSGGAGSVGASSEPGGAEGSEENRYPVMFFEQESLDRIVSRMKTLESIGWIDDGTYQVAAKMIFMNKVGLVQRATIRFLFLETGGVFTALSLQSSWLEGYRNSICLIIDAIWIVLLGYIFLTESKEVFASKKRGELKVYFSDVWNCLDWATIVLGWAIVALFLLDRMGITKLVRGIDGTDFRQEPDESYWGRMYNIHKTADALAANTMWYRLLLSDYMMLIMLRCFKAFKGQPRLAMVTNTMQAAGSDLFHFGIVFFTIFTSFAFAGTILFGRRMVGFSTMTMACGSCFAILCGEFDWGLMSQEHLFTSMIWFWTFMILVFLVMLNMVLAIVMDVYTRVRADSEAGDPIWVNAADIIHRIRAFLLGKVSSDDVERDIEDKDILKVIENFQHNKVNVHRLMTAIPSIPKSQAQRVVKDASEWHRIHQEQGMSLSDAMKLISRINHKVDALVHSQQVSQKNDALLGRKKHVASIRRRIKRTIFTALYNGDLKKLAEQIEREEMQKAIRAKELTRKMDMADSLLTPQPTQIFESTEKDPKKVEQSKSGSPTMPHKEPLEVDVGKEGIQKSDQGTPASQALSPNGSDLPPTPSKFFRSRKSASTDLKNFRRASRLSSNDFTSQQGSKDANTANQDSEPRTKSKEDSSVVASEILQLNKRTESRLESLEAAISELSRQLSHAKLEEVSSRLGEGGFLEKTLMEVASCLTGLRTALALAPASANIMTTPAANGYDALPFPHNAPGVAARTKHGGPRSRPAETKRATKASISNSMAKCRACSSDGWFVSSCSIARLHGPVRKSLRIRSKSSYSQSAGN